MNKEEFEKLLETKPIFEINESVEGKMLYDEKVLDYQFKDPHDELIRWRF